ncbi:GntR family transcriptional regulator [Thermostilla marina]
MLFHIDPQDELPIYDQIVRQLKFAVAAEILRPGELIPSVRETAKQVAVNPNTVARAYRCLQDEGVLVSVRGTGLAVADDAVEKCRADRIVLLRQRLRGVFQEAGRSGLEPHVLKQLVDDELARVTATNATLQGETPANSDATGSVNSSTGDT